MFDEGRLYRLDTKDTQTFMLVGPRQRNDANRAVKVDVGYGAAKATCYTTSYLTRSCWQTVEPREIPPKILAKITAKAAEQGYGTPPSTDDGQGPAVAVTTGVGVGVEPPT